MTELLINELFGPTFQGEGVSLGRLCGFIRFFGCNLHCSFCFGIKPGRRIPRIITTEGNNRKLFNVKIGDKLLTYNDSKELVETQVTNALTREVEKWYEILIEGVIYFVTPEHPFFTNKGLVEAKDLKVGDEILHCLPTDKASFRMINDNPMKDANTVAKMISNTDYKAQGDKVSKTIANKKKNGTYRSTWEIMSEEKVEEVKRKIVDSKLGEKNPNWKGGSKTPNFDTLKLKCSSGELTVCQNCGDTNKLEVHHLNNCLMVDYAGNDQPENLEAWCHPCHSQHHKRGYNFWVSPRSDGKVLPEGIVARNGKKVQSIKYVDLTSHPFYGRPYGPKRIKVYNFSCEPYNSYLVDYMWVHNCDSAFTWRVNDKHPHDFAPVYDPNLESKRMSVEEITDHFREMNPPMLVITGGEPMLQAKKLPELITALINEIPALTRIEIETAGTIWNDEVAEFSFVHFNVSPKLNNSGNEFEERFKPDVLKAFNQLGRATFKFVVCNEDDLLEVDWIVEQIGIPNHKIYIMPEGIDSQTQSERLQYLADEVLKRRWNLTTRLHVLIWQNKRGV